MTEKLTTNQLLQPQRLEGEDFETYKKRRKDMSKVVAQHLSFPGTYSAEYHTTKRLPKGYPHGHYSTKPQ